MINFIDKNDIYDSHACGPAIVPWRALSSRGVRIHLVNSNAPNPLDAIDSNQHIPVADGTPSVLSRKQTMIISLVWVLQIYSSG